MNFPRNFLGCFCWYIVQNVLVQAVRGFLRKIRQLFFLLGCSVLFWQFLLFVHLCSVVLFSCVGNKLTNCASLIYKGDCKLIGRRAVPVRVIGVRLNRQVMKREVPTDVLVISARIGEIGYARECFLIGHPYDSVLKNSRSGLGISLTGIPCEMMITSKISGLDWNGLISPFWKFLLVRVWLSKRGWNEPENPWNKHMDQIITKKSHPTWKHTFRLTITKIANKSIDFVSVDFKDQTEI